MRVINVTTFKQIENRLNTATAEAADVLYHHFWRFHSPQFVGVFSENFFNDKVKFKSEAILASELEGLTSSIF